MNRRVLPLIIGSLLLPLGCGLTGPDSLIVTTTSLPNAAETLPYNETLAAIGADGGYTWTLPVGSLPTDLSLNPSTGEISGIPTVIETDEFTVEVTSGDGQTAAQALTITVGPYCSGQPATAIPTFEDAKLEGAIRRTLGIADLTCGVISGLTDLTSECLFKGGCYSGNTGPTLANPPIRSIVGIQNLTGLTFLSLNQNSITDISALSGLTSLTTLYLHENFITDITPLSGLTSLTTLQLGHNPITDITPLSGLTSLTILGLDGNRFITDISALSGLTSLTHLNLDRNSIIDISALSGLTSLTNLDLLHNSITDISALSGLTSLTHLALSHNRDLSNIQALLDNAGLSAWSDRVGLRGTMVSCTDVAALQAKGVRVTSDCP